MGQLEELKLFISERLHAVTAEILGAIEKAITDYEDQASPLKEENGHHLPMLDTVVKSSIPKTEGVEASSCTGAADPFIPSHPNPPFESEEAAVDSNDLQFLFTSYASFLKYATSAANGSCLYCLKYVEASETHLMKRHYLKAVHFILDGTESFVVPCVCKARIQVNGRSHWHCPLCRKIIFRTTNFEQHLSKQHDLPILQGYQGTDADHSCVFFEETALNSETCRQPLQLSSTCQRPSLQLKTEAGGREMLKPASHPEVRVKHPQTQEGTSNTRRQEVQEDDPLYPASSVCVVGYSEHPSQNTHVESSTEFLSNFPTRDFHSGICRSSRSAQRKTERNKASASCLKAKKQSARPCGHQPPSGPHCCKACGKTFHYIYTLRAHARGHTADNVHVCGICGKHLGTSVNLISHLQSSRKGGGCGPQGKLLSNVKKHKTCH
ncbi:hypothetical protein fugu_018369 [Takifugu bimaculatus]|uniref:C2H2-type domain-containing protein n=1 Tax=Takifugu bimaculatus TaxID=433685 RepID=A0A4Z2BME6_9TELE|nr:hypothetical protein fugu_018369 [Takifugu bimaculatus]